MGRFLTVLGSLVPTSNRVGGEIGCVPNSSAIGAAQGAWSWRAFREYGTQAIVPNDIAPITIAPGPLANAVAAATTWLAFTFCRKDLEEMQTLQGTPDMV